MIICENKHEKQAMSRNFELKVRLDSFDTIKDALFSMGVRLSDTLLQVDKYYLVGEKRLKMRNVNGQFHLIYYKRPNNQESKLSTYYVYSFSRTITKILEAVFNGLLGEKVVVKKTRYLYLYENTRIHLDDVDGLGSFLELETVFGDDTNTEVYIKEHGYIVALLGLDKLEKVSSSYSDLAITSLH